MVHLSTEKINTDVLLPVVQTAKKKKKGKRKKEVLVRRG